MKVEKWTSVTGRLFGAFFFFFLGFFLGGLAACSPGLAGATALKTSGWRGREVSALRSRVAAGRGSTLAGAINLVTRKPSGEFGGSATLTTTFLKDKPELAKKYVAAYAKAVDWVRKYPDESRTHLDGFTAIDESLVKEVPLSGFTLYNEFKPSDVEYFQKFFDVFTDRKIFSRRLDVKSLLYTG